MTANTMEKCMTEEVTDAMDSLRSACDALSEYHAEKEKENALKPGEESFLGESVRGLTIQIAALEMTIIEREFDVVVQRGLVNNAKLSVASVLDFLGH